MIEIKNFVCNMLQENCYIVNDETKDCVIIDCGAYYAEERKAITNYIDTKGLKPKHLIATHGHLDHNFGNNTIFEAYGLKVEISYDDVSLYLHSNQQAESFYGLKLDYDMPEHGHLIKPDETIKFGDTSLKVIYTPGHSKGSVSLYDVADNVVFTGDTLFHGSIGRTDFTGGNMMQIIQSLRTLAQLPDETIVLPGHGAQTTIGAEVATNPYMER